MTIAILCLAVLAVLSRCVSRMTTKHGDVTNGDVVAAVLKRRREAR